MWAYLGRRLFQAFFTLLIITMVCFILTRLSSDPMAQYANKQGLTQADKDRIRHSLGLDRTIPVEWVHWMNLSPETENKVVKASGVPIQYFAWLGLALKGELGNSFFSKQPVTQMIGDRLSLTLILTITAEICTLIIALVLGIISAVKQYSALDNVITSFSFIGYSMGFAIFTHRGGHMGPERSGSIGAPFDPACVGSDYHNHSQLFTLYSLQYFGNSWYGLYPDGTRQRAN
jgi:peptide/nickel transport system permease protein